MEARLRNVCGIRNKFGAFVVEKRNKKQQFIIPDRNVENFVNKKVYFLV